MQRLIDIYQQQFKVNLAVQFQYRVGMAIWMIEVILQPTIYLVVWSAAAGGGEVGGFGAREFAAYYIALLVVIHATQTWNMWEMEWLIREGQMSARLLRPLHPIHVDIVQNMSYKTLMLFVVVPAVLLLSAIFNPIFNPPLWALALMPLVLFLAAAMMFIIGWVTALAAFWTTRILAINSLFYLIVLFFSGQIAPLNLLPAPLQAVATLLPFRWGMAFPVELFLGRLSPEQALTGIIMQVFWLGVCLSVLSTIWRAGVKRYGAVGG